MDLWVVGAAAAAGYIAKQLKLYKDEDSSLESSSGATEYKNHGTFSCPLRRLTQRKKEAKDVNAAERQTSGASVSPWLLDGDSEAESASTSGLSQKLEDLGDYGDCSRYAVSGSSDFLAGDGVLNDNVDHGCVREMDSFHCSMRNRGSLRNRRLRSLLVKPLTSLESCLMAQLYNDHTRVQEYMLSTFPSPSTPVRPFIVTDGRHILSRANSDSFSSRIGKDSSKLREDVTIFGVPPLPKSAPLKIVKKVKPKAGRGAERFSNSSKTSSQRHSSSQNANRREVDQLKDLLKQTENLVQDLQEELEMKDSLTVKELVNETCESQGTCENSLSNGQLGTYSPVRKVDNSKTNGYKASNVKAEASCESMSKIEAELEAELERLGLNLSISNSERRFSDLVEMDPDYEPDFAEGELRADTISNRWTDAQSESDRAASSTSTRRSANYAVSPRELTLRLHQVIQSRLEDRVMELETALQTSQRKVLRMEAESNIASRNMSLSMLRYSSDEESAMPRDQPLVINLSGEALDAYNEAYAELSKPNQSGSDESPDDVYETIHQVGLPSHDRNFSRSQSVRNGSKVHLYQTNLFDTSSEHGTKMSEHLCDSRSDDKKSDCSEEMEKQLIKHIVEKTRQGSPAVLNAQRLLFSMGDDGD